MITNVSDCTAFVWPPKAAVPSWLNQTSANVLIAPDLHSALLAVVANDTNPVICFTEQNDDLFPVANGLIRYADLNATFESLTLAGFNKSVLIDPTLDFTGLRCVDPNVTCTLTIQDVVVYTDIGMPSLADDSVVTYVGLDLRWTGSVVLDRVRFNPRSFFSWGTGAPNNIKIDGNLTVTDCEFSGIFSFRSGAWMSDTHTAGAVWSISRTKIRTALIDVSLSHESECATDLTSEWACVNSSFTFSDIAFDDDVFWKVDAHRIVLDNVTESGLYSRHLAMGADVVIRNSNLAASWTLPCTATTCQISAYFIDDMVEPPFNSLVDPQLNKHFLGAHKSFDVSDTVFFSPSSTFRRPPLLTNLRGGVINGSEPTYAVRNVTAPPFQNLAITVCPWAQPAIVNSSSGIFCKKCPAGQMPDVQFRKCIDCAGSCDVFQCVSGSRWTGKTCEDCPDGVVFNGTECACPAGTVSVKNNAALQMGILTCITPADSCVSGIVIGSFCLDLINGIALSVGAVCLVVTVIAVAALRRARLRNGYQPIVNNNSE